MMRHPLQSRLTHGPTSGSTIVVAGKPDEEQRLTLASALICGGYDVRLASSGDQVLREARTGDVAMIVAEVDSPCAEGSCVIEALKRSPELSHIPVVAYSTRARVVSEVRALSSGADRFIGDAGELSGMLDIVGSLCTPGVALESAGR